VYRLQVRPPLAALPFAPAGCRVRTWAGEGLILELGEDVTPGG